MSKYEKETFHREEQDISDEEDLSEMKYAESKYESSLEAKSDEGKGIKISGEELLERVQEFFYSNDELAITFENFVKRNAHVIDLDKDEYRLEYTAIYNEYKALYEDQIEGYISSCAFI
jgi:histone deacetylase complex regulatory component SIN3